jgi:hypothetical protein
VIAQGYPLWLAEVHEGEVRAGRVVGWLVPAADAQASAPLVAFTLPDGLLLETRPPRGTLVFLGDSRDEAVIAANRLATGAPLEPLPPDEPGADPPPERRPRFSLHRTTPADLETDEAGGPGSPGSRTHRSGHA